VLFSIYFIGFACSLLSQHIYPLRWYVYMLTREWYMSPVLLCDDVIIVVYWNTIKLVSHPRTEAHWHAEWLLRTTIVKLVAHTMENKVTCCCFELLPWLYWWQHHNYGHLPWHLEMHTLSNSSPFLQMALTSLKTKLHTSSTCNEVGSMLQVHVRTLTLLCTASEST